MTAAVAAPVTRQPVPWDPWCWLQVQISTATGTTGDPDRVGYWQQASPDTADPRYTVWQANGVTPPPAGGTVPAGYGEWVQGNTGTKWGTDWSSLAWQPVDCDLTSASFFTGSDPWDWNAPPGNGTLRLVDPDHTYFPSGPGSGYFDDIGVNTPIRVIANLTADFDQVPANAAKRLPYRVLVTGLVRSIDHELTPSGTGATTIHFSEPHVLYGRVNRPSTALPGGVQVTARMKQLHDLSDDPLSNLIQPPMGVDGVYDDYQSMLLQADDVAADLWTEMCNASNSVAHITFTRLYLNGFAPAANGNPRVVHGDPQYPLTAPANAHTQPWFSYAYYGLDSRTVSPECSAPDATFNYTTQPANSSTPPPYGNPNRVHLSMCPTGSLEFGHGDAQMANSVSIAAKGGTATVLEDQASIDRFYRHTFQRHDLICATTDVGKVAARTLDRLTRALYSVADCDYMIDHPRDFEFALGAAPLDQTWMDHPPVEPNRWIKLDWDLLSADLRVTRVAHQITPTGWTVTHSYEIHNPETGGTL